MGVTIACEKIRRSAASVGNGDKQYIGLTWCRIQSGEKDVGSISFDSMSGCVSALSALIDSLFTRRRCFSELHCWAHCRLESGSVSLLAAPSSH